MKNVVSKEQYWKDPQHYRDYNRKKKQTWSESKKLYDTRYRHAHIDQNRTYKRQWAKARQMEMIAKLGGKCFGCGLTNSGKLGFHHLSYPNGKPKTRTVLFHEVDEHPEKFRLLCDSCHSMVTILSSRFDRIPRILRVLEEMGIYKPYIPREVLSN